MAAQYIVLLPYAEWTQTSRGQTVQKREVAFSERE